MKEFTDEQLRYLCDLVIQDRIKNPDKLVFITDTFDLLDTELTRREELADLDFEDDDALKLMVKL